MRHGSVPKHSGITYYRDFGGAGRPQVTRQTMGIVPMSSHYKVDGHGRDTYISMNNGGLYSAYNPDA